MIKSNAQVIHPVHSELSTEIGDIFYKEVTMLPDNRLDKIVITNEFYLKQIEYFREAFIELDQKINLLSEDSNANPSANRCLSVARTALEQCSMYTNKALAIMGGDQ